MGAGGEPHAQLGALRERYALSLHGVGLSIGSTQPLDREHLERVKLLCERYEPASFSEHLAWSSHDGVYFNDLLPLPYTPQTLARVAEHIDTVQAVLSRPILLENPSSYLSLAESAISEADFLAEVSRRTGCGLLLDVNNVFVSSTNLGGRPYDYLDAFPLDRVREIHLGDPVQVSILLVAADEKRLHTFEELRHASEGWLSATSENMTLHIDMAARKTAPFPPDIRARIEAVAKAHSAVAHPEGIGRNIAMPSK